MIWLTSVWLALCLLKLKTKCGADELQSNEAVAKASWHLETFCGIFD